MLSFSGCTALHFPQFKVRAMAKESELLSKDTMKECSERLKRAQRVAFQQWDIEI